ncbi:MAG TPA: nicotinate-nucleotide diphosphorylase (carboxylating), partial [Psychrobacter pasteurii]|nr:nicotinate-nucleotide diphosphorylase (carboxylating) [Psychrobacter pasteurii]
LAQAKQLAGHLIPIEIEVDTLEQLQQAIDAGAELVLLDNMSPDTLREAVAMCKNHPSGRVKTEASGGITPDSVVSVAETGVDFIAMGYLTHSTTALDIGMDFSA